MRGKNQLIFATTTNLRYNSGSFDNSHALQQGVRDALSGAFSQGQDESTMKPTTHSLPTW